MVKLLGNFTYFRLAVIREGLPEVIEYYLFPVGHQMVSQQIEEIGDQVKNAFREEVQYPNQAIS
jgi:hypothetical protein